MYQHFPLQDPPRFSEIGIFGLITNHLATLLEALEPFFQIQLSGDRRTVMLFFSPASNPFVSNPHRVTG
jgi:hypothetical protein